ncbi:hypothetical protein GDO81_015670 [Engystomops pustulosus]|uniref:Protein kinase domain-containing protein n=1 Tax=Engystomops pustulosus TaxID=76066 RepID=A0AAV7ASB5_ENGPU|nr:hypothetical protein GDO81_015670 [Engystomops pustulosus]
MDVVKTIFTVANTIYDQCDKAQTNKKRCYRLKKRIQLLLIPAEKLKNDPDKSRELERTLSELLVNLKNAKCWVMKYSRNGWWRQLLQAGSIQNKFIHINEQLGNTAQSLQFLLHVEQREEFLKHFLNKSLSKQNLKDIEEDQQMPLIEREITSIADKLYSVDLQLLKIKQLLQAEIVRPWDIKEIRSTDLHCGELLEIPGMMTNDSHSLYLGEYHKSKVVIKVLKGELNRNDDFIRRTFQSETQTMKKYESPNILRLYGICIDNSGRNPCYSLVMEYCEKGTLREVLRQEPHLSWERRIQMSLDAARALYRLHQTEIKTVLYGSLSSSKFLVDGTYCLKLSGFELSKTESSMRRNPLKSRTEIGELVYLAPETMQDINAYDKRSEIYSLGVVIFEIAVGGFSLQHFSSENLEGLHQKLCVNVDADLPALCPPVLCDVIKRSQAQDPGNRPSAGEIADLLIAHLSRTET